MTDTYTKLVLTVIAAALVALSAQQLVQPAAAVGGGCGGDRYDPCWVRVTD